MNKDKENRRRVVPGCAMWLVCLVVWPVAALAQKISVQAPSAIDLGDSYFQIRYVIDSDDVEIFRGPDFPDFDLLSGPNVSRSHMTMMVNGKRTSESSTTYTYTLAPRSKGKFRIPAATATVGGRKVSSQPLTVTVDGTRGRRSDAAQGHPADEQQRPQTMRRQIKERDLFVTSSASRRAVYRGEAVLLTYDIIFRPGVALHNVGLSKKPDFKGVVAQDIPIREIQRRAERRDGQTYEAGTIYKTVVFPQTEGRLTIPALTFDCVVAQLNPMLDLMDAFFNSGDVTGVQLKRSAPALTIDVKPLPQPAPAGFTDAVGRFEVEAGLLKGKFETNEFCTYRITVSGNGNLNMLSAPVVDFPSDFDVLDPRSDVQTSVSAGGLEGKVVFDYVFVPKNAGHYEIPPLTFVYFDPQAEAYRTRQLPAVEFDVAQGKRTSADVERELALRTGDIRDIRQGVSGGHRTGGLAVLAGAYAVLVVVTILVSEIFRRRRSCDRVPGWGSRRSRRGLSGRMHAVEHLLRDDAPDFHASLASALREAVAEKCGVALEKIGAGTVADLLEQCGTASDDARMACEILEACDFAQFAGSTSVADRRELFEKTKGLLNRM